MASVFDVAEQVLVRHGSMTTMKLQKLVYYCQAWALVWDEEPIFEERIEAWANGPVVPALYAKHRGQFAISTIGGDPTRLNDAQKETVEAVGRHYADKSSQWLSDLTHREAPWRDARIGLNESERGNVEITIGAMADYYGNL